MKKILCLALAALMLLCVTGCGAEKEEPEQKTVPVSGEDVSEKYGGVLEKYLWRLDGEGEAFDFSADGKYTRGEKTGKWWLMSDDGVIFLVLKDKEERDFTLTKMTDMLIEMTDAEGAFHELAAEEREQEESAPFSNGWKVEYDENVFKHEYTEYGEIFTAEGVETEFKLYSETTAISLAGGHEINSEYAVITTDVKIGAGNYDALKLTYETGDSSVVI